MTAPAPAPLAAPTAEARHLDCRRQGGCLALAATWPAFGCAACSAYEPMAPAEHREQLQPLLALATWIEADVPDELASPRRRHRRVTIGHDS